MTASAIISGWSGLPEDQIRLVVSSVLCIPLSYAMTEVPGAEMRRLYSTLLGFMMQWYVYGQYHIQLGLMFLLSTVVYLYVRLNQRKCGKQVTVGSIIVLSSLHIYRLITDYGSWNIDVTAVLMMVICKYSAFAYACEDGLKDPASLSKEQQEFRLEKVPSFYEFVSYLKFLPTATMGPYLEYRQFDDYIRRQKQYADLPDRFRPVTRSFLEAVLHLVLYVVVYLGFFPVDYLASDAYQQQNWLRCALYAWCSVAFIKCRYYFAWKLSSCSIDACGISYSGSTVESGTRTNHFDLVQTCNPWEVERTVHIRDKIKNWNISVQLWLDRCIYRRYGTEEEYKRDKQKQANGQLLVFMVSAFWHGFYAGYYITFFLWYCEMQVATYVFRITRNRPDLKSKFDEAPAAVHYALWMVVNFAFCYFGISFQLLGVKLCIKAMSRLWFVPEITLILLMLVLQRSPLLRTPKTARPDRPAQAEAPLRNDPTKSS